MCWLNQKYYHNCCYITSFYVADCTWATCSRKKQQQLYAFGASASYTEIKRYKILAAATTNFLELELNGNQELTQGVCGNYDTNVTSQNGLKTTHSLATIITQPINDDFLDQKPVVSWLEKAELKNVKLSNIKMQWYKGEKKPLMSSNYSLINVILLKVLCH